MANRKKEDLIVSSNLENLSDILIDNNFGGDILIISSKQNLKTYLKDLKNIDSIKYLDIDFIKDDNFENIIYDTYGLVVVIGKDEELIYTTNILSKKDLSLILIATEFLNLSFLKNKFYILFVSEETLKNTIEINFIKLNYLLAIEFINKNFKGEFSFIKLDFDEKLNNIEKLKILINIYQKNDFFFLENLFFNFINEEFSLTKTDIIHFLKICFLFMYKWVKELKFDKNLHKRELTDFENLNLNKNELDFCLDVYNVILNRYYNRFNQYNRKEYINFKSSVNKSEIKDFFIKFIKNSPKESIFYAFNQYI